MCVPYTITLKWIRDLNLTIDKSWRPWTVDSQVAGLVSVSSLSLQYALFYTIIIHFGYDFSLADTQKLTTRMAMPLSRLPH